jgi:transposase
MARPSALTDERREAAERALAQGAPLSVAAAAADVSPRTLSRWLAEGQVVRRDLVAVPEPSEPAAGGALGDDDVGIERALVGSVLTAAKSDWRAATWLLERRWPKRYGRR